MLGDSGQLHERLDGRLDGRAAKGPLYPPLNAVLPRYEALLPRIRTRDELSDLIWEMQGELGTSHAYEMGGDRRRVIATTLVRTHNWVGRAYLAVIMPFHRVIVRTMLAQAARP